MRFSERKKERERERKKGWMRDKREGEQVTHSACNILLM